MLEKYNNLQEDMNTKVVKERNLLQDTIENLKCEVLTLKNDLLRTNQIKERFEEENLKLEKSYHMKRAKYEETINFEKTEKENLKEKIRGINDDLVRLQTEEKHLRTLNEQ